MGKRSTVLKQDVQSINLTIFNSFIIINLQVGYTEKEKTNLLNFINVVKTSSANTQNKWYNSKKYPHSINESNLKYNTQPSFYLSETNEEEVQNILNSFKNKSSTGFDDIPIIFLRKVRRKIGKVLVHLMNSSFVSV